MTTKGVGLDRQTFAQLLQEIPEAFLPLLFIPAPTVESSILLPLSAEVGPTRTSTLHFFVQQLLKFLLGILFLLCNFGLP